jgi:hypothetical protein
MHEERFTIVNNYKKKHDVIYENKMHYSLKIKNKLPFIGSDLLYKGAL